MKLSSIAIAIAIGVLVAACGGGGGGSSSTGGSGNSGGSGNNGVPTGGSKDDTITPPTIVAGVATFSGPRANYMIGRIGGSVLVSDGRENSNANVTGVNAIRFSDLTVNLGIGTKAATVSAENLKSMIELYMAFLGRVPEADKLAVWIDRLAAGQTMAQIADGYYAEAVLSPSVSGYNATMSNAEYVLAVYKNALGRSAGSAPDIFEVESYSNRIGRGGISRGALMLVILEDTRAATTDFYSATAVQLLDNKADVGDFVAVQQGITYNSAEDSATRTKAIAQAVTPTDKAAALALLGFSDAAFNLKVAGN